MSFMCCDPESIGVQEKWMSKLRGNNAGKLTWLLVVRHLTLHEFQLKGSEERVQTCTTHNFDGVIAVIDPETSWVARWQRTCELHTGISRVKF